MKKVIVAQRTDVTLILPCYNEAEHIERSIKKITRVLHQSNLRFSIILIDDNSTDGTQSLIRSILRKDKSLQAVFHGQNLGRGACVMEGIATARSPVVGFMDIDCEVSPVYIPSFVDEIMNKKADIVVGLRYYPFDFGPASLVRAFTSKIYAWIIGKTLNLSIHDTEAGYKFFNKRAIMPILPRIKDTGWFWDTEIIARSRKLSISEIPVLFLRDMNKTSTVKIMRDSLRYFAALYRFYGEARRS